MEQQELFDDLPKPAPDNPDPPHIAFHIPVGDGALTLPLVEARKLFAALGNFLQDVEVLKNGRK
jgi:hypothetical protein